MHDLKAHVRTLCMSVHVCVGKHGFVRMCTFAIVGTWVDVSVWVLVCVHVCVRVCIWCVMSGVTLSRTFNS